MRTIHTHLFVYPRSQTQHDTKVKNYGWTGERETNTCVRDYTVHQPTTPRAHTYYLYKTQNTQGFQYTTHTPGARREGDWQRRGGTREGE